VAAREKQTIPSKRAQLRAFVTLAIHFTPVVLISFWSSLLIAALDSGMEALPKTQLNTERIKNFKH
jgi:hypothetical protein